MSYSISDLLLGTALPYPQGSVMKLIAAFCVLMMGASLLVNHMGYSFLALIIVLSAGAIYGVAIVWAIWALLHPKKNKPKVPKIPPGDII